MREYKFRVWQDDKMYIGTLGEISYGLIKGLCDFKEDEIVMQYTGMNDKKGKEIYEGDILLWADPNEEGSESYKVNWEKCQYVITGINSGHEDDLADTEFLTLLGNIYQNPELLATHNILNKPIDI